MVSCAYWGLQSAPSYTHFFRADEWDDVQALGGRTERLLGADVAELLADTLTRSRHQTGLRDRRSAIDAKQSRYTTAVGSVSYKMGDRCGPR